MFSPLEFRPRPRERFDAEVAIGELGTAVLARAVASPTTILRSTQHLASGANRRCFLLLPIETSLHMSHYGHETELGVGDFLLTDSAGTQRTTFAERNVTLLLALPYEALVRFLPRVDNLFGRAVRSSSGLGALVGSTLKTVWTEVEAGVPTECGPHLARSVLETVAAAFAYELRAEVAQSSVASARRAQIRRFIDEHLHDSSLTAQSVAEGLGLSPRYTRLLFEAEAESIAEYILRRRLDECAAQLADPLWASQSITDTAFGWGFSSTAHFTRAFKERYAATPSDYRRRHVRVGESST